MKKVLTILAVLTFNLAIAQSATQTHVTRQDGKLIVVKQDGTTMKVVEDMRIMGGNLITTDGKFHTADGRVVNIDEGDEIYINGSLKVKALPGVKKSTDIKPANAASTNSAN